MNKTKLFQHCILEKSKSVNEKYNQKIEKIYLALYASYLDPQRSIDWSSALYSFKQFFSTFARRYC